MRLTGRKRCVFCGADDVTDEHVWPDWVSGFLNEEVLHDAELGKQRFETDPATMQQHPVGRRWGGPALDIKVKRVCELCNSGWMSDVEQAAIPYLKPMIRGERVPVDRDARDALATWAFLRAVMAEYTHPEQVAVPGSHRRWLYQERQPPRQGVYVWLASYIGERWAGYYQHVPLATHRRPIGAGYRPGKMNAYGVTFGVYKLIFQVFGATTAPREGGDLRHAGPLGDATFRIWPNRSGEIAALPRPIGFDDAGLRDFANIFVPPTD